MRRAPTVQHGEGRKIKPWSPQLHMPLATQGPDPKGTKLLHKVTSRKAARGGGPPPARSGRSPGRWSALSGHPSIEDLPPLARYGRTTDVSSRYPNGCASSKRGDGTVSTPGACTFSRLSNLPSSTRVQRTRFVTVDLPRSLVYIGPRHPCHASPSLKLPVSFTEK